MHICLQNAQIHKMRASVVARSSDWHAIFGSVDGTAQSADCANPQIAHNIHTNIRVLSLIETIWKDSVGYWVCTTRAKRALEVSHNSVKKTVSRDDYPNMVMSPNMVTSPNIVVVYWDTKLKHIWLYSTSKRQSNMSDFSQEEDHAAC